MPTKSKTKAKAKATKGSLSKKQLAHLEKRLHEERARVMKELDRKSTRLNSSHSQISYAVFCLKKKKHREHRQQILDQGSHARHSLHLVKPEARGRRPRPHARVEPDPDGHKRHTQQLTRMLACL